MLDSLLGRKELKNRIQELETEVDRLEERLEAENRRRADAVTEKQKAERRVNELESKIEELQDRLQRQEEDHNQGFREVKELRGRAVDRVLGLLESVESGGDRLTSAYVEPGGTVDLELGRRELGLLRGVDSEAGFAVFFDDDGLVRACLVPPLPVESGRVVHDSCFHVEGGLFGPAGVHAVAAVRSDTYAGGVYGDDRQAYSAVSSDVMGGHSKGGWSQARFERRREEQVSRHVEESVREFGDMVEGRDPGLVVVVGEQKVAEVFTDRVGADVTRAVDARGNGEGFLEDAYEKFWSARLYVF